MAIRTYKVTLDSKNTIAPEPVYLRQGDKTGAVVIDATLMDNGAPVSLDGLTPMFKANTADGQAVIADSTGFNVLDSANGEFTYQVPNALSSVPGKITTAYFSLSDSSGSESTFDVAFIIKKAVDISKPQADDYITIIDGTLKSLQQKIDAMNTDIQTVLNAYNQGDFYNKSETDSKDAEVTAQLAHKAEQDALEAEKARIDNLIALPVGSTTNDARLEDIAAGADGKLYDSPGTAVRTQFTKVNSKVDKFKDTNKFLSLTEDSTNFLKKESAYAGSTGYISSSTHDSYEVTLPNKTTLYFDNYDSQYTSLTVFTSGIVGGIGYTRYRTLAGGENTLPTTDTRITLSPGAVIIVSVSKAQGNFTLMQNGDLNGFYLSNAVKLNTEQIKQIQTNANTYLLTYIKNNLSVIGNGLNCDFNTLTFTGKDGLFELQNLTYNNDVIFGTNNDYIGPLRVNGEPIKGAKHDGEVTDSVLITTDKGVLKNGETIETSTFTVFVKSHISDEFNRISSYSFDGSIMKTNSIINTLKALQIDYVFGAGIISCQDDVNVTWLNKEELTKDVLIGLNEETSIICNHGTLISKRLSVNSDYGDKRVAFNVYSGRKKLYYYTCYGNNIAVPSDTVFASSTELVFS